jgi:hypothetical protein
MEVIHWQPRTYSSRSAALTNRRPKTGSIQVRVMLLPTVSRPVCHGVKPHLGSENTFLVLSDICGFIDVGRPLRREDGSVVHNCWCRSPTQLFSGPSPAGLMTTFCCPRFRTFPTWRDRSPYVPQEQCGLVIPSGTSSLFAAS